MVACGEAGDRLATVNPLGTTIMPAPGPGAKDSILLAISPAAATGAARMVTCIADAAASIMRRYPVQLGFCGE
jgi:hypothetical protein